MKRHTIFTILILLLWTALAFAGDNVECKVIWDDQPVTAGGYIETFPIGLSAAARHPSVVPLWRVRSGGILSLQPNVTEGTFTFTVYFSNYPDASVWDSGTDIATGITSGDTDRIPIDPDGVALWMKIRATETSGTGNPSLSAVLCSD